MEPTVNPILISSWPEDGTSWFEKLTAAPNYNLDGSNTIIIDEAQLTYWDFGFWNNFLKSISPVSSNRIILFGSYGSPTVRAPLTKMVTPYHLPDCQRVDLRPVDHKDNIPPAGLLLLEDEFSDLVQAAFPGSCFTTDFREYVFAITAGHVGAVVDLLSIVKHRTVGLCFKLSTACSLKILSRHTVNSSTKMEMEITLWRLFIAIFLSKNSGRASNQVAYSDVGSP